MCDENNSPKEEHNKPGIHAEGFDTKEDIELTPPPPGVILSLPIDRLNHLFKEVKQIAEESGDPGTVYSHDQAETVLVFFTLASAIIEDRCRYLILQTDTSELVPEEKNAKNYVTREMTQGCRLNYLVENVDEFENGLKSKLSETWQRRSDLVHSIYQYRQPDFDIMNVGENAMEGLEELNEISIR